MGVIVGIEGGGTKTGCAVLDEGGTLLAYGQGGPANLNFVSESQQRESFETAIESALKDIHEPIVAMGYTVAGTFANWQWVLERLGHPLSYPVEETRMAMVSTGVDVAHGIAVVAGTGSIISAFVDDRLVRTVGGWGALIGDDGSAYDVSIRGIRMAVRSWDKTALPSALEDAVRQFFGINDLRELIPILYQQGMARHELAQFAKQVLAVAEQGDYQARAVLLDCSCELACDAVGCAILVFGPQTALRVALTGGMFRQPSVFTEDFKDRFSSYYPRAEYYTPVMAPAAAVARVAWLRWQAESANPTPHPE